MACIETYMAGVLNVSDIISVIFSLLAFGLSGASVRRAECSSGATRSSLCDARLIPCPSS